MLEHQEYLSLIAELAVALAGFTGIVAVFRFRSGDWEGTRIAEFQTMLRASVSAMFLAILPYLLFTFLDDAELTWRIGNFVVFLTMALNILNFMIRGGLFRASFMHRLMFPIGISIAIGNLLGTLQTLPGPQLYLLAISFQLLVSVYNFSLLILSDGAAKSPDTEQSPESQ